MNELLRRLQQQRAAKTDAMKALLETVANEEREMSDDELNIYGDLEREYNALGEQIARVQAQIEREGEINAQTREPLTGNTQQTENNEQNPSDVDVDHQRYSLFRVLSAMNTGDWSKAEYEREVSDTIAENLGRDARGVYIPTSVQRSVLTTTNATALVGTEHRDDLYIESLQAESIVMSLGAKLLDGLVGNVDIPKALGGASFSWIAEEDDAPETDASFGTVSLAPKTIAGAVAISRRLLKQSTPSIEALIEADIRRGVALAIDEAVLAGDGANNAPVGILNTTGVNTVTISDTTDFVPTFEEAVEFETTLAEDNALRGSLAYVTTPKINGLTKTKPIDSGSGIMLNQNNTINGYKVVGTSLIPAGKTIFGNWNDVIIGMWGVMDLVLDTATRASKGGLVLRVFQDVDVAIRHPESFCIGA